MSARIEQACRTFWQKEPRGPATIAGSFSLRNRALSVSAGPSSRSGAALVLFVLRLGGLDVDADVSDGAVAAWCDRVSQGRRIDGNSRCSASVLAGTGEVQPADT